MKKTIIRMNDAAGEAIEKEVAKREKAGKPSSANDIMCEALSKLFGFDCAPVKGKPYFQVCKGKPNAKS